MDDYIMMVEKALLLKQRVVDRMIFNEQSDYEEGYLTALKQVISDIEDIFWETKDSGSRSGGAL